MTYASVSHLVSYCLLNFILAGRQEYYKIRGWSQLSAPTVLFWFYKYLLQQCFATTRGWSCCCILWHATRLFWQGIVLSISMSLLVQVWGNCWVRLIKLTEFEFYYFQDSWSTVHELNYMDDVHDGITLLFSFICRRCFVCFNFILEKENRVYSDASRPYKYRAWYMFNLLSVAAAPTSSTEDVIKQVRSKRPMSRIEVTEKLSSYCFDNW